MLIRYELWRCEMTNRSEKPNRRPSSENGDRWILQSGEDDIVSIRHVPNAASGCEEKTS